MFKKSTLLIGATVVLVACGGEKKVEDKKEVNNLKNVQVEQLKIDDYEHWVSIQGAIEAKEDAMIVPQASGTIRAINVSEGDYVKKGKVIAVIDSDIISKNIQEVETALELAEYALEKQTSLMKKGVGTEFEFKQAENQVKSLESKLETLKTQAGKSVVTAPFEGIVDQVFTSTGELGAPQVPICHLVGLNKLTASGNLSDSYIKNIKEGSVIDVVIPALDTTLKNLSITRASKFVNPKNGTYKVEVALEKYESIVPNLTVQLKIMDEQIRNVKQINNKALQYDKQGNQYIFVANPVDSTVSKYTVEVLSSYNNYSAIKADNLNPGSAIVIVGGEGIEDKEKVNIK